MRALLIFLLLPFYAAAQMDSVVVDSLKMKPVMKEEVIVSATRAGENSPTTFQVLDKKELNKNNLGQDLPILLDMTPSAVVTSDAGAGIGYTGIRIRGSDATRVNVTLNGIPVNDAESQAVYWVNLPDVVGSTQSIQIQRGVGTSTNGPGAFGGTVSMETQQPGERPFGEVNMSGGSFQTLRMNAKAGTGLIKKRYFLEGGGSWITSNGYIERASSNLYSMFAQAGYQHKNTLLKAVYFGGRERTYQSWYGVTEDSLATNRRYNVAGTDWGQLHPPYRNQVDNYGQDYFQLLFSQYLPANLNLNIGLFTTLGRGYYEEYKVDSRFGKYFEDADSAAVRTDLVRRRWLKNVFYGGTFSLNYERRNINAMLGGSFSQYRGMHFGNVVWAQRIPDWDKNARYYEGEGIKNDFNVYAKFNYDLLRRLNIFLDMQYRYVGYATDGMDNDKYVYSVNRQWHFVNPKAGLLYKIQREHHAYASYAMGNREPNRDDLLNATASRPPRHETMHNIEAGYKFLHRRFPVSLNYYLMQYDNQLVLTGRVNDVGNPIKENVRDSYRTGIELNGGIHFNAPHSPRSRSASAERDVEAPQRRVFSINYSLTYSWNKIRTFDEYIYTFDENYSPVDSLTLIIRHKNTDISFSPNIIAALELAVYPVKGLSISLMNKFVGRQYLDNTSNKDRSLKPFYYSNLNISYSLPLKQTNKEVTLKILFNNIYNHLFVSNGYTFSERYAYLDENSEMQVTDPATYNYFFPQAGFNVLAGVSVRF